MLRIAPLSLLLLLSLVPAAWAQPESLKAEWKRDGKSATYWLERTGVNHYTKVLRAPDNADLRRATLFHDDAGWALRLEMRVAGVLGLSAIDGEGPRGTRWEQLALVELEQKGRKLRSDEWKITLPREFELEYGDSGPEPARQAVVVDTRPVVKVLITGFDKFPRPINHPRYVSWDGTVREQNLSINPSGWVVRAFDVSDLSAELRRDVRVEIYKCNDVPVNYVDGAKVITDTIDRIRPDVAISFGVGAGGGADADVESSCENIMDDTWESVADRGRGPFQLPDDWPPQKPKSEWTDEEKAWSSRYPDNVGVSYNDHPIDPDAPESLDSTLPVDDIVRAVNGKGLRAVDGAGGPGRYICNNVMFRVIQAQARNGRLGGFIHLPSWRKERRDEYLTVLSVAIEQSVRAFQEQQAQTTLPGGPVLPSIE